MTTNRECIPPRGGAHAPSGIFRQRTLASAELLGGARELAIEHAGETYRLRITSKGKLILTK